MPYRQSLWRTDLTIEDIGPLGPADKWEGGEKTSDTSDYPRASGSVALGGRASREDGTATYLYDERFHASYKTIERGVGRLRVVITRTPLGDDGTAFAGGGYTLTGRVKSLTMPGTDYGSNDGAEVEIGIQLDADFA
jgi:hypothetical protein